MDIINLPHNIPFQTKLDEIHTALSHNKWVDSKLNVRTKDCRFVRILKTVAGFIFGINMFSHIKTNKVALSLFQYCKDNKQHLDGKAENTLSAIFSQLSSKAKSSKKKSNLEMAATAILGFTSLNKKDTSKQTKEKSWTLEIPESQASEKSDPEQLKPAVTEEIKEEPKKEPILDQVVVVAQDKEAPTPIIDTLEQPSPITEAAAEETSLKKPDEQEPTPVLNPNATQSKENSEVDTKDKIPEIATVESKAPENIAHPSGNILVVDYQGLYVSYNDALCEVVVNDFKQVPLSEVLPNKLNQFYKYRNIAIHSVPKYSYQTKEAQWSFELTDDTSSAIDTAMNCQAAIQYLKEEAKKFVTPKQKEKDKKTIQTQSAICIIASHGGSADHFATFIEELSKEKDEKDICIFASGPALKKFQETKDQSV